MTMKYELKLLRYGMLTLQLITSFLMICVYNCCVNFSLLYRLHAVTFSVISATLPEQPSVTAFPPGNLVSRATVQLAHQLLIGPRV